MKNTAKKRRSGKQMQEKGKVKKDEKEDFLIPSIVHKNYIVLFLLINHSRIIKSYNLKYNSLVILNFFRALTLRDYFLYG